VIEIHGYVIGERLSEGGECVVYRGSRMDDGFPVVCKVLNREYPTAIELSRFRNEYRIAALVGGHGGVRALDLVSAGNALAMVFEDTRGIALDRHEHVLGASIGEKLTLAVNMADALSLVHEKGVIHRDICPSNILTDSAAVGATFIDFGLATELSEESVAIEVSGELVGTLSCVAPEQTGRLNSRVDFRSDLYSLGAVLYWLFSGQMPFTGKDDLELVYAHIAKEPTPLAKLVPGMPGPVGDIVAKLLRKAKDERYQSAVGLARDLRRCADEYASAGEIAPFTLCESDGYGRFFLPGKVYGRKAETESLLRTFAEVTEGASRLLLVSGEPGVGKTTLVREIHASVALSKSVFVAGKCNQLERNVPYGVFLQAFRELEAELSMMGEADLESLRSRLAPVRAPLIELVPELSRLLGESEAPATLEPAASQRRLTLALWEFLAAVAREERPLVVFLDDLQWCDAASMEFLQVITGKNAVPRLLVVGAYRVNEVPEGHPLNSLLRSPGAVSIRLGPLDLDSLNLLVSDSLRRDPGATGDLTAVLYAKSGGNPFYAKEILLSLRDTGAFALDPKDNRWNWDIAAIERSELGANVIDFLVAKTRDLPGNALSALKIAACIGDSFDARLLSLVGNLPLASLEAELRAAMEREIIVPLGGEVGLLSLERLELEATGSRITFKFRHDRLRQAILSITDEGEMRNIRARIGAALLADYESGKAEGTLIELVNHLNAGITPVDGRERRKLAELNRQAGDRAMRATAFRTAAEFYGKGRDLLNGDGDESRRETRFALALGQAEAAFLAGDPDSAQSPLSEADSLAAGPLDSARVAIVRSRILEFGGNLYGAIGEIRRILILFAVRLPESDEETRAALGAGLGRIMGTLAHAPIESLPVLDETRDAAAAMSMRLLAQIVPAAIQVDYQLYLVTTLAMVDLTLAKGLTQESCKCVVDAGIMVASMLGEYETGYRLGKAAFTLLDRLKAEGLRPSVYFSFTYVSHMRRPFRESLEYYGLSYRTGLENGDMQHAMYALSHRAFLMAWTGIGLEECERETAAAVTSLAESRGFIQLKLAELVMQAIRKLRTPPGDQAEAGWDRSDGELLAQIHQTKHMVLLVRFAQFNAFFHYLTGEREAAEKWNDMAEGVISASGTDFPVADHYLVRALLSIDRLESGESEDRDAAFARIDACLDTLKKWADSCPENFEHKFLLVSAELSAYRKEPLETTLALYRRAASSIAADDFPHMAALVKELEGRFWLRFGDEAIAKAFLQDSRYRYERWGAIRKARLMERAYPLLFSARGDEAGGSVTSGSHRSSRSLDLGSITKSVQAISGEIKADQLLITLMGIVMENAGAQKGCIVLDNDDGRGLTVEARKTPSSECVELVNSTPLGESEDLCLALAEAVKRGKKTLALDNASGSGPFRDDPYVRQYGVKSVLCMPILRRNAFRGLLYLENNLSEGVFNAARLAVLEIIAAQAAISTEIARLYSRMEEKVNERTRELNEANAKLKELTLIDPLTQLNNRRYFLNYVVGIAERHIQKIVRARERAEHRSQSGQDAVFGVFLVDIDHFKTVNDEWGHAVGDEVLVGISNALRSLVRADDFIIRWGGEEFLVILNNTKPEYLDSFARKVLKSVAAVSVPTGSGGFISKTCSVGYASLPFIADAPGALSLEQTVMMSDRGMYIAKGNGRNRAVNMAWKGRLDAGREGETLERFRRSLGESPETLGEFVGAREVGGDA